MTSSYALHAVAVRGGDLVVGVWEPRESATATVIAVHGITGSNLAWLAFAAAYPTVRVIAPDLRGRGGSRTLPGPWPMAQHAEDVVAVLDAFAIEAAVLIGHSMGAFVAARVASAVPDRVSAVVLLDGGLPIPLPEGTTDADLPGSLIGPAAARLSMTFRDEAEYRAFWRAHPAFATTWGSGLERYVDYDLITESGTRRPASILDAVTENSLELSNESAIAAVLDALTMPVTFVRAPRGLLDDAPLYSSYARDHWASRFPRIAFHDVADANHYTIVMSSSGVVQLAPILDGALSRGRSVPAP